MSRIRTNTRSFAGGELTPEFFGHIDDAKYQTGLALARNMIVLPHGPAANRSGTRFVRKVKDSTKRTRLLPFTYSEDQSLVIEFGAGYFRFHALGATVLDPIITDEPYEVVHPYTEAQLFDVKYVQSADVVTLVHPAHPPRELRRLGATNWQLVTIAFQSAMIPPTGVTGTPTAGATPGPPFASEYVVTSVAKDGVDESLPSASVTISNNLYDDGAYNTIGWSAAPNAIRYNVYKRSAGLLGYIGQTELLTFRDDNIAADLGKTPPLDIELFQGAGNYPAAVSYFEQRRVFAGTVNQPQHVFASRSGTESNFNYSIPIQDDDSIQFRIAAREGNAIRHVVPMSNLILLTAAAVWRVTGANSDILTPPPAAKAQSYAGASTTTPTLVNTNLLYVAAKGGHIRELGYAEQAGGYVTGDISLRAPHLFDGFDVVDMAYASAPYPIVWMTSSAGKLLGLTYVPEQNITAWHQHDTADGRFESVTTVPEGDSDVPYVVVQRTLGGQSVRTIEYMPSRILTRLVDSYFVDCGATYDGAPATTISGLSWLEGEEVAILADGAVHPRRTVVGGAVVLDNEASVVHIGLPIEADTKSLPLAAEISGYAQGLPKNVNRVFLRVHNSSGIFAGPTFDELTEAKQRTDEPFGSPPRWKSEEIEIVVDNAWSDDGAICIRQADPLPLTLLAWTLEVEVGGG